MKTRTDFPFAVTRHDHLPIRLPDGTTLSSRLWRPDTDAPVPLILEYLPYRYRDGTIARDELTHPYFAGHGYACLRVDMRGNGESEGLMADEYTPQELQDACDVIAWARAQDWCSGKVGMMGISWGGFNGLQVAALRPEGLEAVITLCSTVDRYADDIHYKGGCLLGENLGWATQMLAYSSRPPDPMLHGDNRWREMWLNRLENQPFHLMEWLRHQHRDAYWKHGSVCEDYGAIKAAVLSIGGWHDGYRNTIAHLVENLNAPVKGIVGPWNHKYPHFAGPEPRIGFLQEALRWWDRWLKDIDTGVEDDPDMRLWLMDSVRPKAWLEERPGRWIADAVWPNRSIRTERLELGSATIASPVDCGTTGGEFFPFAFGPELPLDQRADDALSATFDSAPLDASMDVVGAPRITARLVPQASTGQIAVRLCDVFPDGTSALISHGVLNLCHRDSHETPSPLVPGRECAISFRLDQIAYRVPAGHRLRVSLSSAYWPFLWPSPEGAALELVSGHMDVPVRPTAEGDEWTFEPPEGAPAWKNRVLRDGGCTRTREVDLATGASVMVMTNSAGELEDLEHGLITSSDTEERWSIVAGDPLSAKAEISWVKTMRREGWSVKTEALSRLTCSAETFVLWAELRCWEGDDLLFERIFEDTIPRDLV